MKLLIVTLISLCGMAMAMPKGAGDLCPSMPMLEGRQAKKFHARLMRSCGRVRMANATEEEKGMIMEEQDFYKGMFKLIGHVKKCAFRECPVAINECGKEIPECRQEGARQMGVMRTCCGYSTCVHACFDGTPRGPGRRDCVDQCLAADEGTCCGQFEDFNNEEVQDNFFKCGEQWTTCMSSKCKEFGYCQCAVAKLDDYLEEYDTVDDDGMDDVPAMGGSSTGMPASSTPMPSTVTASTPMPTSAMPDASVTGFFTTQGFSA